MAMRCFGRARLAGVGARPLLASFFRADDLTAALTAFVLAALALAALRAGVFFCEVGRLAGRDDDFLVGFFLAINVLPFRNRKGLAQFALRWWQSRARANRRTF